MNFSTLRRQIAQLKAAIPAKKKPFVAIFRSADGTMNPYNLEQLRRALAVGAHIVEFRFIATPREGFSP
jgi:ribosomal protein L29